MRDLLTRWVRVQSAMTVILGDLIYRTACAAAAMWAVFIFVISATLALPDWIIATPIAAAGAVLIWSVGRAARYVLSRSRR
jgi:hypothetical protein